MARTKGFMNEAAPAPAKLICTVKGHTIPGPHRRRGARAEATELYGQKLRVYMACSVTMAVIPYVAEFVNGSS